MRELRISVQGDRLIVETEKQREEMANLIGLRSETQIFSIGNTPESLADDDHFRLDPTAAFRPIFDSGAFNPDIVQAAIGYLSVKSGARPQVSLIKQPFDLTLDFPGYENLPRDVRDRFEMDTQFSLSINRLQINGQQAGYTPSQKRSASISHDVFGYAGLCIGMVILLPLIGIGIYGGGYAKWSPLVVRLATAGLAVLLLFVVFELSDLGWVRVMRDCVPHHLIRLILHRSSRNYLLRKRFFAAAERILADSTQPDLGSVSKP